MNDDRRALRARRLDILAFASFVSIPVVLIAIYRFDFPPFAGLAIVAVGTGASMVSTLRRFGTERRQIVDAIPSLAPDTAVVQSSMSTVPLFVYPQFFLERSAAGLSFRRVGGHDETVLIRWPEIESVDAAGAATVKVTIAFHDGTPLRLSMAPASTVPDSAGQVRAWLRGEAKFPEPYAAARYLLPRTPGEGRR